MRVDVIFEFSRQEREESKARNVFIDWVTQPFFSFAGRFWTNSGRAMLGNSSYFQEVYILVR